MLNDPVWVDADELIDLNRRIVAASGEPHALLMEDVLRSAAHRPIAHWEYDEERDPLVLGVRLLMGVSRSQAFIQGNKRTGYYGALRFFDYNSLYLDIDDIEDYADLIIDIIEGKTDEAVLIEEWRPYLIEIP